MGGHGWQKLEAPRTGTANCGSGSTRGSVRLAERWATNTRGRHTDGFWAGRRLAGCRVSGRIWGVSRRRGDDTCRPGSAYQVAMHRARRPKCMPRRSRRRRPRSVSCRGAPSGYMRCRECSVYRDPAAGCARWACAGAQTRHSVERDLGAQPALPRARPTSGAGEVGLGGDRDFWRAAWRRLALARRNAATGTVQTFAATAATVTTRPAQSSAFSVRSSTAARACARRTTTWAGGRRAWGRGRHTTISPPGRGLNSEQRLPRKRRAERLARMCGAGGRAGPV